MLIRQVVGDSMRPALTPGSVVIARRNSHPVKHDIVIARQKGREVIKRVAECYSDGAVFLRGDNVAHSTDSRTLGTVETSDILGVVVMKLTFAKQTPAPVSLWPGLLWLPYVLAVLTVVMLISQLLTFDKFLPILLEYRLPGGVIAAKLVAALLVATELFALPFWLRLRLSPLARICSAACGVLFTALWLGLGLWALAWGLPVEISGHFGGLIELPFGWWIVLDNLVLLGAVVLAAYVLNALKVFRLRRA